MQQLQAGTQLGRYKLVAELDRGSISHVFAAIATGPEGFAKLSVVKVLRDHLAEDPDFIAMFREEARVALRLSHPNIVHTYDVRTHGSHHYIAMEYLEGQCLARVLDRLGRDNPRFGFVQQAHVLIGVLSAMQYAHELAGHDGTLLKVVHRDLSPPNVFITYDGQVKVLDFGIAKALDNAIETKTGLVLGRVAYIAPEQALGRDVDSRADLYAIAVMLWEAAAGRRRWQAQSDAEILARLVSERHVERPAKRVAGVPREIERILAKGLAFEPGDRHQSAAELRGEIEGLLERMGASLDLRAIGRIVASAFELERKQLHARVQQQFRELGPARAPAARRAAAVHVPVRARRKARARRDEDGESLLPLTTGAHKVSDLLERRIPWKALGLATAIVSAAGAYWLGTLSSSAPAEAPAQATQPAAVRVRIAATPSSATLFVDDQPLPTNPAELSQPDDDVLRVVRAELAGHRPLTRLVRFREGMTVTLVLEPLSPPAPELPSTSRVQRSQPVPAPPPRKAVNEQAVAPEPPTRDPPPGESAKPEVEPDPKVELDLESPWPR
jgi:eukaryotic-like serine/threonine-protein kinase